MSDTTSDKEWQRMATSGATGDNECYNEWERMTTSNNEWPFRLVLLFRIREESTIKHPKENSLNLKEDLEEKRNIELRAEGSA